MVGRSLGWIGAFHRAQEFRGGGGGKLLELHRWLSSGQTSGEGGVCEWCRGMGECGESTTCGEGRFM